MSTQSITGPIQPRPIKTTKSPTVTKIDRDKPLTRMQEIFVEQYMQGKSARKAAEIAGYSPTTCEVAHTAILKHPAVIKEIRRRMDEIFEDEKLDTKWIIRRAFQLANSNILDVIEVQEDGTYRVDLSKVTRDTAVAIKSLAYDPEGRPKVELVDPNRSVELLARIYKLLGNDKNALGNEEDKPLTTELFDALIRKHTINQNINITVRNQPEAVGELPQTIEATYSE